MSEGSQKPREINLGDDCDAVVRYGGTTVELKSDGNVVVKTKGNAIVYTNGDVKVRPAANDDATPKAGTAPKVGDRMADGTVYAGTSPDTGKAMYATQTDAPLTMKWKEAMEHAAKLDAHGHQDWHVPTKGELNVLRENWNEGALKGTFNVTGSDPAGWYWSSSQRGSITAWNQRFSDGYQDNSFKNTDSSLRCVRG